MEQFLTLQYYFNPSPNPDFQFTKLTLLLVGLLFLTGIGIKIYRKKRAKDAIIKKMLKRYPGHLSTFGIVLLILLLFREAGFPFLSMRIWWIAFLIFIVYWALKTTLGFKKEYKKRLHKTQKNAQRAKYMPKRKR